MDLRFIVINGKPNSGRFCFSDSTVCAGVKKVVAQLIAVFEVRSPFYNRAPHDERDLLALFGNCQLIVLIGHRRLV